MATDPEAASLPDGAPAPLGESLLAEHATAASTTLPRTDHAAGRAFRILFLPGTDTSKRSSACHRSDCRRSWPDPDTEMNG